MAYITGNAAGVDDVLFGTADDDVIQGLSGDDYLSGGRGDDILIGGTGSDVMSGGVGADTFQFSAGHISDGATDYIIDFDIRQNDKLNFLDSGEGQEFLVLSVVKTKLDITEFNGYDLRNNVASGTDIVFTVQNSVTGATQDIVLFDVWSSSLNAAWVDYLASMGLSFGDNIAMA